MSTLDELFNHGKEFAKLNFDEAGQILPMWIGENNAGERFPVMVPMMDDDKQSIATAVRQILRELKAVRYVSLLESWVLEADSEREGKELMEDVQAGPIREHPKRKEIIYILAQDKFNTRTGLFYIVRPDAGKPYLSTFKHLDANGVDGTFSNLLSEGETIQ